MPPHILLPSSPKWVVTAGIQSQLSPQFQAERFCKKAEASRVTVYCSDHDFCQKNQPLGMATPPARFATPHYALASVFQKGQKCWRHRGIRVSRPHSSSTGRRRGSARRAVCWRLDGVGRRPDWNGSSLPKDIAAGEVLDLENEQETELLQLFCSTVQRQAPIPPIWANEMSLPSLAKCARKSELFSMLMLLKVRQQSR